MKRVLKFLLPIVILAIGIYSSTILKASRPEPVAIEAPEKEWSVDIVTVEFGAFKPEVQLYARIESPNQTTLSAAVASSVDAVDVREGEFVTKGQLLAVMDSRDLLLIKNQISSEIKELNSLIVSEQNTYSSDQAALVDEQALLSLAQRNLSRARKLAKTKAGSEVGVDDALQVIRSRSLAIIQRQRSLDDHVPRMIRLETNLSRVQDRLAQLELDLEKTRITAPFNGRVINVHVSPGERLRLGDGIIELYDTETIEARAQIPERFIASVRSSLRNNTVLHGTVSIQEQPIKMRLDRLAGFIRQGQGGLDGYFAFDAKSMPVIEVGRVVELRIELSPVENSLVLPVSALYGSNSVYRIVDGRLQGVDVQYSGELVLKNGIAGVIVESPELKNGDRIVTTQIPAAVDGLKVREITN